MSGDFSELCPNTRVLLVLLSNGKIKRSHFEKTFGVSYRTAVAACQRLETLGLTKYEAVGDRHDTVYWSLTEKGIQVAERLKELDEFIRND